MYRDGDDVYRDLPQENSAKLGRSTVVFRTPGSCANSAVHSSGQRGR